MINISASIPRAVRYTKIPIRALTEHFGMTIRVIYGTLSVLSLTQRRAELTLLSMTSRKQRT